MHPTSNPRLALRAEIGKVFAKAKIPTSPALAARVLELTSNPRATPAEFAEVIRTDAALTARLLNVANSVAAAQGRPVTTIERAVTIIGLRRVKTIALGFRLVEDLGRLGDVCFDMRTFWRHSLLRACFAKCIARTVVPGRQEEAFLIGLLLKCGVPILAQVLGPSYASQFQPSELSLDAFYAVEKTHFPYTHVEAISAMAEQWHLPELIAAPLRGHHEPTQIRGDSSDTQRLSAVSYLVGALCFPGDLAPDAPDPALREFGSNVLGIDWRQAQEAAAQEYNHVSILFEGSLPEDVSVLDLLGEANQHLTDFASDAEARVSEIQAERDKLHREHKNLAIALREYRERAGLDPLTGALNRGALWDVARHAIEQNHENGASIAVFFADLDDFKRVNDVYGHEAGDRVLKSVALVLGQEANQAGSVGRYGGEEFALVFEGISADTAHEIAEGVVRRTRMLDVGPLGLNEPVTLSLGAIWYHNLPSPSPSPERLFAAADQLMYRAKRSGKNRCCFEAFHDEDADPAGDASGAPGSARTSTCFGRELPGGDVTETLKSVAERLSAEEAERLIGIRKQARQRMVELCVLHCWSGDDGTVRTEPASLRNISTGGAGVVLRRPLVRGEPVEIELNRDGLKLSLRGLVTFGRYIEESIHDTGIQFVVDALTPLVPEHASQATGYVSSTFDMLTPEDAASRLASTSAG